jgi:DnaJ-class molecular chaperone
VKKKYRELSKTLHPDRGGDAAAFDNIAKAYQALTNDESRENWEKYGNPDGPKGLLLEILMINEGLFQQLHSALLFRNGSSVKSMARGYWHFMDFYL